MSSPGEMSQRHVLIISVSSITHLYSILFPTVPLGWGHLLDKVLAPKSLSQGLLLGNLLQCSIVWVTLKLGDRRAL